MSKIIVMEHTMERNLVAMGYDIYYELDGGKTVDSTLVIEYAIQEGYTPKENDDGIYMFTKELR